MRLSTVFELLLIFLLIAFAAYGRVIDRDEVTLHRAVRAANESRQMNMGVEVMSLKQATENVNKYCVCNANICNCCRNFNIPLVQLKGPGCASLQYLEDDKLAVQLSMGENILTSTVVNGQKPKAVCFPMPGGLTKFCGRIYSIQREADNHFKACLGLELQSSTELEAALRVSCFRFGPDGVKLRPAEQLPIVEADTPAEEDDDDDIFGLDDDDDDDDDDDEDAPEGNAVPGSSATNDEDDEDDDDDLLGFGALLDILTGDDDSDKKKKPSTTVAPILPFTIPMLMKPTPPTHVVDNNGNSAAHLNVKPVATPKPEIVGQQLVNSEETTSSELLTSEPEKLDLEDSSTESFDAVTIKEELAAAADDVAEEISTNVSTNDDIVAGSEEAESNNVEYVAIPDKPLGVKKVSLDNRNKPSLTSGSINAIKNDVKKPSSVIVPRPPKPDPVKVHVAAQQHNEAEEEDDEEDDDDDILGTSDLDDEDDDDDDEKFELEEEADDEKDEDEEETVDDDKLDNVEEDDKVEEQHDEDGVEDLIDDDDEDEEDEEEDAVLSALVEDDKDDVKIKDKVADNEAANPEEDDNDYGLGLAELLSRKRHMRSGRQSKVMRL